jgi:hypothetical protein
VPLFAEAATSLAHLSLSSDRGFSIVYSMVSPKWGIISALADPTTARKGMPCQASERSESALHPHTGVKNIAGAFRMNALARDIRSPLFMKNSFCNVR